MQDFYANYGILFAELQKLQGSWINIVYRVTWPQNSDSAVSNVLFILSKRNTRVKVHTDLLYKIPEKVLSLKLLADYRGINYVRKVIW